MTYIEKTITFQPAYDKRTTNPKTNYGIHGVDLRFVYKGPLGATQFLLYTNWHLPHVQDELDAKPTAARPYPHLLCHPQPADLGYHAYSPRYPDQSRMPNCDVLDHGYCYYDGSSLNAERVYQVLLTEGSDGVWRELESYYNQLFLDADVQPHDSSEPQG